MPAKADPAHSLAQLTNDDEFEDTTFTGVTQPKLDLRGKRFANCTFKTMQLAEVQLADCVLSECRFERCDLSLSKLVNCSLREVHFEHTKLMGVDWSVARDLIFDVSFHTCLLSYGSFFRRRMRDTKLIHCVAHEADFSAADLTSADFTGSDLRDARFEQTNLTFANLSEARGYRINPADNTLKQTRFSMEAALDVVAALGIVVV